MKKILIATMIASMLAGCGDDIPKTEQQVQFEQQKEMLRMQQQHEREMAKIQAGVYNEPTIVNPPQIVYQEPSYDTSAPINDAVYSGPNEQRYSQADYVPQPDYREPLQYSNQPVHAGSDDSSGSSVLGTVGTLAAGAALGYVAGELLDSGHRSYTDSSGNRVYVDKSGKQISQADYERYRRENPVKSKISDANLKSKQAVNSAATKTAEVSKKGYNNAKQATQKAATATKSAASKASQSVRSATQKATSSSRRSSKRK